MNPLFRSLRLSFLLFAVASMMTACETSNQPKKRKPVPPGANQELSNLPWNRPRAFESNTGMGRMMPQSR